jgi:hypothetical protein
MAYCMTKDSFLFTWKGLTWNLGPDSRAVEHQLISSGCSWIPFIRGYPPPFLAPPWTIPLSYPPTTPPPNLLAEIGAISPPPFFHHFPHFRRNLDSGARWSLSEIISPRM